MKLDMSGCTRPPANDPWPGYIYPTTKGTYNLIIAIRGNTAYCLVFNGLGEFTGVAQYGVVPYFHGRAPVAKAELPDLMQVEWFDA